MAGPCETVRNTDRINMSKSVARVRRALAEAETRLEISGAQAADFTA